MSKRDGTVRDQWEPLEIKIMVENEYSKEHYVGKFESISFCDCRQNEEQRIRKRRQKAKIHLGGLIWE